MAKESVKVFGVEKPWTVTMETYKPRGEKWDKTELSLYRDGEKLHSVITEFLHQTDAAAQTLRDFVQIYEYSRAARLGVLQAEKEHEAASHG